MSETNYGTLSKNTGTGTLSKKKERKEVVRHVWGKDSVPQDLDFIDKGDHLKIETNREDAEKMTAWWLGTLRAKYPQDSYSTQGRNVKMRPSPGVTLSINKGDGTLRIKGKKHWEWFKENFDQMMEEGSKELALTAELNNAIHCHLQMNDGQSVDDLLRELPPGGAIKHGPSYIYRLWKGLLDRWIGYGDHVYVVTPLLDAIRLHEILLLIVKQRLSRSQVHIMCMPKCDGETQFPKIFKQAKQMVRGLKSEKKKTKKKRLIAEDRLQMAEDRLEARFSGFHCKFIAMVHGDRAEVLTTSANFHKWHFEVDNGDILSYFRMSNKDLKHYYLEPLGLARPISVVEVGK